MSCSQNKNNTFLFRKHLFDCQNLYTANKLIRLQRTRPGDRRINDAAKSTCSETTRHLGRGRLKTPSVVTDIKCFHVPDIRRRLRESADRLLI